MAKKWNEASGVSFKKELHPIVSARMTCEKNGDPGTPRVKAVEFANLCLGLCSLSWVAELASPCEPEELPSMRSHQQIGCSLGAFTPDKRLIVPPSQLHAVPWLILLIESCCLRRNCITKKNMASAASN